MRRKKQENVSNELGKKSLIEEIHKYVELIKTIKTLNRLKNRRLTKRVKRVFH